MALINRKKRERGRPRIIDLPPHYCATPHCTRYAEPLADFCAWCLEARRAATRAAIKRTIRKPGDPLMGTDREDRWHVT